MSDPQTGTTRAARLAPTGTVTFLFTDIEGSTQRWDRDRAAMQDAVRRHDAILRSAIESHDGHVFKTIGDAFCAVFARAEDGVAAALEAQRALAAEDFSAVEGVRVRMALHTGTTDERDGDYYGPAVNRVARLLSIGHGEQILLGSATADLVLRELPHGATLRDMGAHRLKGIAEPERVHQVVASDLRSEFPALQSIDAYPNNLPLQMTSFIGRDAELAQAKRLFEQTRLLTLAGTGGVGKTRLALQLAADVSDRFPDGEWFIDLAPLPNALLISPTALSAIGVREEPGRNTDDTLVNHLREKSALLILDNCEHVVAEASRLTDRLLQQCARLHVLATTREVLSIAGEVVHRIPTFGEDEGVALFASRAAAVVPSFSLTPENAATIKRICKRLDGIALAIELAAARVKMMTVQELSQRLDDRFRILTGGSRTALPRQQTLRGLIGWSYDLLAENEKALLRRLAIFAGDFSLEAATAVCALDPIEDWEVLELLAHLVDKSLVHSEPSGEQQRYRLLESTKEFALERLCEAGEQAAVRQRHTQYFQSIGETMEAHYGTPRYGETISQMARDYDEYRAILQWAFTEGNAGALEPQFVGALSDYWYRRGQWREGGFWLDQVLHREEELPPETRGRVLFGLAQQYLTQGEYTLMEAIARRAEEAWVALGNSRHQANLRSMLAIAAQHTGRFEEARDLWHSVLVTFRDVGDRGNEAVALQNLAELLTDWKADYAESERLFAQAVTIYRELGDLIYAGYALGDWSQTAAYQGAFDRADSLARESLGICRRVGNEMQIIEVLIRIGHYRVWAGVCDEARGPLGEAMEGLRASAHPLYIARCADACADYALALAQPAPAAALLAFGDAWRTANNLPRPTPMQTRCESALASACAVLGEEAFEAALETGRVLSPEGAIDLAESLFEMKA